MAVFDVLAHFEDGFDPALVFDDFVVVAELVGDDGVVEGDHDAERERLAAVGTDLDVTIQ